MSNAAAPNPAVRARATAAGARRTSGLARGTGSQPRRPIQVSPQPTSATTHQRAAQASRHDPPMTKASAAATKSAQPSHPVPTGPVSKRSTCPRPNRLAGPPDPPKTAVTEPKVAQDHGNNATNPTSAAPTPTNALRTPAAARPLRAHPP